MRRAWQWSTLCQKQASGATRQSQTGVSVSEDWYKFLLMTEDARGGLKPWLRSGKPCGLDQPGAPRHREG
jgi:hypothetical protein